MERLTKVDGIGENECIKCFGCDSEKAGANLEHCGYCEHWQHLLDRLAAYEDTGLTPEEIMNLFDTLVSSTPTTSPGGAAQDSGKNQLAVTAHQIAKKYRPLPSPRRIMDEMRALVKQHGPENLRDAMQEQLENMWEAYMEEYQV